MVCFCRGIYFSILSQSITEKNWIYPSAEEFSAELSWEDIVSEYSSRPYHNLSHIAYMLNLLKIGNVRYEKELIMAIFWHDVVLNFTSDDEQASVDAMQVHSSIVEANGMQVSTIADYIIATSISAKESSSVSESIIADIDKAILAAPFSRIWNWYENGVKEECMQATKCSEKDYEKGRKSFLSELLERPRIFQTELFNNMFEEKARQNIIKQLKKFND